MPTTKTCTKCGETKPLDGFSQAKGCKYGVRATCKSCKSEYSRRWREKNLDEIREKQRRHYEANRDKVLERQRRYQEANRDEVLERKRRHYKANRDKILEYQRGYQEANRDRIVEYQRRYREENRDIVSAQISKYRREAQEITTIFATVPKYAPWTPEEEAFLLADNGMTMYQKSVKLGRGYNACTGKLAHLRRKLTA